MIAAPFSTILLAALLLMVPATLLVIVSPPARGVPKRGDRGLGRVAKELLAVALVAAVVVAVADWRGAGWPTAAVGAVLLAGSIAVWHRVGRDWSVRGLTAWALTVTAGATYLAYVLTWTLTVELTTAGVLLSLMLWLVELFVFLIGVGFLWEFVDVLARRRWPGAVDVSGVIDPDAPRPFVSLHVPTHNEPPDMVIETLEHLLRIEYDAYEILLVDNNTTDSELWRPVEEFCARHDRLTFIHLQDWPGYKSGALNYALTRTDPRAEVIGIIDADYHVAPDFLARCAPLFDAPDVSFVQTPQDYREWEHSSYFRRLYYSYSYFFDVSQRSRSQRNGAIFGGTMGLIRRSALEGAGGWDEWCITEDAELSLRLLRDGGRGLHIAQSFGHGVMPLTFEALKRQRFRWCFGGVQILRMHWRSLLPGRRTERNRLNNGQRWAYLVGGLQWFGDLATVLFTGFLLLGAADAVLGEGVVIRRLSGVLLMFLAVLIILGMIRALALVRRTSGARWGEALGAFGLWVGLGWAVAQACFRGLFAREGVFLRTPKVRGELGLGHALRGNVVETCLAAVCMVAGTAVSVIAPSSGMVFLSGLLLLHAALYAAAPLNSLAAIRVDLPEPLHRRRRSALVSWGQPALAGGMAVALALSVTAVVMLTAAPFNDPMLKRQPGLAIVPLEDEEDSAPVEVSEEIGREPVRQQPAPAATPPPMLEPPRPSAAPASAEEPTTAAPPASTPRPGSDQPSAQQPGGPQGQAPSQTPAQNQEPEQRASSTQPPTQEPAAQQQSTARPTPTERPSQPAPSPTTQSREGTSTESGRP